MANISISNLSATPDFSTQNRQQQTYPNGLKQTIWSKISPPNDDGSATGSVLCTTFVIPTTPDISFPLELAGICSGLMVNNADCVQVTGSLDGIEIIKSTLGPLAPGPFTSFNFPAFNFIALPKLPVRLAGDWSWVFEVLRGNKVIEEISCSTTTRLELCFTWFGPPAGPTTSPNATRPDFQGIFPIDVFRLFLPTWPEAAAMSNPPWPDYLKRSLNVIWNLGTTAPAEFEWGNRLVSYETLSGHSAYIDGSFGGTFQLRRFANCLFDSVNCYDLAALAQLAACIMIDRNTTEVLDSKWIFCQNYGYIRSGPLIGWLQFPTCNSPFFGMGRLPYYANPNDPQRQSFGNHAWVEVLINPAMNRTVLDATHCLQGSGSSYVPASGTQDRLTYLAAQTDKDLSALGRYRDFFSSPDIRPQQIGVVNIGDVPAVMMRAESRLPVAPDLVNNGPCTAGALLEIVCRCLPGSIIDAEDCIVAPASCQKLLRLEIGQGALLYLEITNHEGSSALTHFATAKQDMLSRCPDFSIVFKLGHAASRLPSSVLWRRNLSIVRIWVSSKALFLHPYLQDALVRVAEQIDDHLDQHAVPNGQQSRPDVRLDSEATIIVSDGDQFTCSLSNTVDVIKEKTIRTSTDGCVMCLNSGDETQFDFLAVAPGNVSIEILLAHDISLAVQKIVVNVEVRPKGDAKADSS